jgi:hypothetical protein
VCGGGWNGCSDPGGAAVIAWLIKVLVCWFFAAAKAVRSLSSIVVPAAWARKPALSYRRSSPVSYRSVTRNAGVAAET